MRMFNTNFLAGAAGASQRFMNLEDDLRNKQIQTSQFGANLALQNRAMRQNIVNALAQTQIAKNPGVNPLEVYNFVDKTVSPMGKINETLFNKEAPKLMVKNAVNLRAQAGNPFTAMDTQKLINQAGIDKAEQDPLLAQLAQQQLVSTNQGWINPNLQYNPKTKKMEVIRGKIPTWYANTVLGAVGPNQDIGNNPQMNMGNPYLQQQNPQMFGGNVQATAIPLSMLGNGGNAQLNY